MKTGGIGGGHTISGLYFEGRADLVEAIKKLKGYKVGEDGKIFFKDKLVAQSLKKNKLYKYLDPLLQVLLQYEAAAQLCI